MNRVVWTVFIVLSVYQCYTKSYPVEAEADIPANETVEIEALFDYESGLIFYKDHSLAACLVETISELLSDDSVWPEFKIPILPETSPQQENLEHSKLTSELGKLFCGELPVFGTDSIVERLNPKDEAILIRRKRQSNGHNGYYRSSPYIAQAGAQSNSNNPGQASQAQVQGQVFGRGIFSGQAQSQNGGLSQSQVQLAGVGISGQIASSSGNAQAQLALGSGAGSGQAAGLGQGPSASQVQVNLGQNGEESMASASATSGGSSAGAGNVHHGGAGGAYGGSPYGQTGGQGYGGPGYGYIPQTRYPQESIAPGTATTPFGGGQVEGSYQPHQGIQGLASQNGISSGGNGGSSPGISTVPFGTGQSGGTFHPQQGGFQNGLTSQTGIPSGGIGSSTHGLSTGPFGSGQNGGTYQPHQSIQNGLAPQTGIPPGGIGGSGLSTVPFGSGLTGGTFQPQQGIQQTGIPSGGIGGSTHGTPYGNGQAGGGTFQPQQTGIPSGGIGSGTHGISTSPIGGGQDGGAIQPQQGIQNGLTPQTGISSGGVGGSGQYRPHATSYDSTYRNGHGAGNGRPYAHSSTPGAFATSYGLGQAQAQTVYFGSSGNGGQYTPVRYAQSSHPGSGNGGSRYQDQQVGYGTAGQRQQNGGPISAQNGISRINGNGGLSTTHALPQPGTSPHILPQQGTTTHALQNGHRQNGYKNGYHVPTNGGADKTGIHQLQPGGGTGSGTIQGQLDGVVPGTFDATQTIQQPGFGTGSVSQSPGSGITQGGPVLTDTHTPTSYTTGQSQPPNGYLPGRSVIQNGHRQNGRNGYSYRTNGYSQQVPAGGGTPGLAATNGKSYRINEHGQVVPQHGQQTHAGPSTNVVRATEQNGFSPSYGITKPSAEDPDGKKCTIITFSCTIVIESNGRAKICRPNAVKMNGNGHHGSNGNGAGGGSNGSKVCCC